VMGWAGVWVRMWLRTAEPTRPVAPVRITCMVMFVWLV
jgi:hypothetical protein